MVINPSLRTQFTCRTFTASISPIMVFRTNAAITSVAVFVDQSDALLAGNVFSEAPARALRQMHQRRFKANVAVHAKPVRLHLGIEHGFTAIGVTGEIGLTHTADENANAAPISQPGRQGQENKIAPGNKRRWEPVSADGNFLFCGHRRLANFFETPRIDQMVRPKLPGPVWIRSGNLAPNRAPSVKLNRVTLAIFESDGFNILETIKRPQKRDRGVLSARKKNERLIMIELAHMPLRTQNYVAACSFFIRRADGACNMADATLLYSTAPDQDTAQIIANALIAEKLAACVNILSPMISVYEWKGVVEHANETPILIKTTRAAAGIARGRITELHPSECPCVLALNIDAEASSGPFLDWIQNVVGGPK